MKIECFKHTTYVSTTSTWNAVIASTKFVNAWKPKWKVERKKELAVVFPARWVLCSIVVEENRLRPSHISSFFVNEFFKFICFVVAKLNLIFTVIALKCIAELGIASKISNRKRRIGIILNWRRSQIMKIRQFQSESIIRGGKVPTLFLTWRCVTTNPMK